MAAGTNVRVTQQRQQFQSVFEHVWVVRFNVDTASIGANSTGEDTIAVPGVDPAKDVILGFTEHVEPAHDVTRHVHVGVANVLHVTTHNTSGGAYDPAAADFTVVIARVRADA